MPQHHELQRNGIDHRPPEVHCHHVDQPTLSIRFSVPRAELSPRLLDAFRALFAALTSFEIEPAGPAFVALHGTSERGVELEAGVPVSAGVAGHGKATRGSIPMGRYLALLREGDGPTLSSLSHGVAGWLQSQHETTCGPIYVHLLEPPAERHRPRVSIQRRIMAGTQPAPRELSDEERDSLRGVLDALALLSEDSSGPALPSAEDARWS